MHVNLRQCKESPNFIFGRSPERPFFGSYARARKDVRQNDANGGERILAFLCANIA